MAPSYLTRSRMAWVSIGLIVIGLALTFIATASILPTWLIPVGYFLALAGSALLFVGWLIWKERR